MRRERNRSRLMLETRMMHGSHNICCYVLSHGDANPVWFGTVKEAVTYISAENVGRGLPPVTRIVFTNLSLLCFDGQDRYCGMILGERGLIRTMFDHIT